MLLDSPLRETLAIMQSRIMTVTHYRGVEVKKCPLDMWVYSELLFEIKPDVVIEIGNWCGGTMLYLSDICYSIGLQTRLIGVDIDHSKVPSVVKTSNRILLIEGDAVVSYPHVRSCVDVGQTVLVIEDSSHEYANTLSVLDVYSPLVNIGSYIIAEDSICRHGLDVGPSPGPMEAVAEFKRRNPQFVSDDSRTFGISWNETGYLKRVK